MDKTKADEYWKPIDDEIEQLDMMLKGESDAYRKVAMELDRAVAQVDEIVATLKGKGVLR